jgi:hypothetical protein
MMLNAPFSYIVADILLVEEREYLEKTTDLSQVTDTNIIT